MVEERNLSEQMLTAQEVSEVANLLGMPIQDLLRPSSPFYKEHKEKLLAMEPFALAEAIAAEPTLIKRPIVKSDKGVVLGLDEAKIIQLLGNKG